MRIAILILLVAIACSGCYTERRATRQVAKAAALQPLVVATVCAQLYPPVDSVVVRDSIHYIPGVPIITRDTVEVDCDDAENAGQVVRIPCPPREVRVDTMHIVTEKFTNSVNRAKVAELQQRLQQAQTTADEESRKRKKLTRWIWILSAVVLATNIGRIMKLVRAVA